VRYVVLIGGVGGLRATKNSGQKLFLNLNVSFTPSTTIRTSV
jgi:hypothetical protein